MINENNSDCCKCTNPEYILEFNEQGPQGRQGRKGNDGFSPSITVETDDYNTYTLKIQNADGEFITPNLKYPTIPSGGIEGQLLAKGSGGDGDLVWDNNQYITSEELQNYLIEKYVTLDTKQTISGSKSFENYLTITKNSNVSDSGKLKFLSPSNELFTGISLGSSFNDVYRLNIGSSDTSTYLFTANEATIYTYFNDGTGNSTAMISAKDKATIDKFGIVKPDGDTITINEYGTISSKQYELPTASTTELGGVKVDGTTILISDDGIISGAETYILPIATSEVLGGIKVGSDLTIAEDGTLTTNIDTSNLVTLNTEQKISGGKTFTNGIVSNKIVNTNNYGYLSWNTSGVILGSSNYNLSLKSSSSINVLRKSDTFTIIDTGNISNYIDGTTITWNSTTNKLSGTNQLTAISPITITDNAIGLTISGSNLEVVDGALTVNLDEIGNEVTSVAGRVTTLETDLASLTTQVDTNTSDLASIQEELDNSNDLVAGTNISIVEDTSAKTTTINCTLDISSLSSDISSLQSQLATLETTVSTKADSLTVSSLQSTVTEQGTSISNLQTTVDNQATTISELQSTISTLQSQLEAALSRITELETTIDGGNA